MNLFLESTNHRDRFYHKTQWEIKKDISLKLRFLLTSYQRDKLHLQLLLLSVSAVIIGNKTVMFDLNLTSFRCRLQHETRLTAQLVYPSLLDNPTKRRSEISPKSSINPLDPFTS